MNNNDNVSNAEIFGFVLAVAVGFVLSSAIRGSKKSKKPTKAQLQKHLDWLVEEQKFEQAARLRDRISAEFPENDNLQHKL